MRLKILGNKIRAIRQMQGISQEAIAVKLKISQRAMSKIENGKIAVKPDRLKLILIVLGISHETFMNFEVNTVLKLQG